MANSFFSRGERMAVQRRSIGDVAEFKKQKISMSTDLNSSTTVEVSTSSGNIANAVLSEGLSYGHICTNTNAGKCTFRPYPTLLCSLCRGDGINVVYDKKDEDKIIATVKTFA